MLTVYTSKKYFRKEIIRYIDETFLDYLSLIKSDFDEIDTAFLKEIDKAEPFYVNGDILVTKGKDTFRLQDISDGAKTCMLAHHLPEMKGYVLDMAQCGQNAIMSMFVHLEMSGIPLYINNQPLKAHIPAMKGIRFNINNKFVGSFQDLWNTLKEG